MKKQDMSQMPKRFSSVSTQCDSANDILSIDHSDSLVRKPIMSHEVSSLYDSVLPSRVYIRSARVKFSTHLQVLIKALDTGAQHDLCALLDSGATGLFLSTSFVS